MRPSELAPSVLGLIASLLEGRGRVLAFGHPLALGGVAATYLKRLNGSDAAQYDAAVLGEPSRADVGELVRASALLAPSARLVIVDVVEPSAMRRLRAFVAKERREPLAVEELCSALLLLGYLAPRVYPTLAGARVVTAERPAAVDALDVFFAQPPSLVSR